MRMRGDGRWTVPAVVLVVVAALILSGCGSDTLDADPTPTPQADGQSEVARTLVVGNIDANNPSKKIKEFQPLADYLAAHLESFGVQEGRVVIAQDTAEMARLMGAGEVDLYIDATIPILEVCSLAECEIVLRQWKGGEPEAAGVFVTGKDSGIASIEDLLGKVVMLEDPHSTVGHILPLSAIAQRGIAVREVSDPLAEVGEDEIGYYVSTGGQSSMSYLLNGDVDALVIGERAFQKFSADVQEQVTIFEHTVSVPGQLVSARAGLDPDLENEILQLMVALKESDEGKAILKKLRDTQQFDELPPETAQHLDELWETVNPANQE